jgi:uncharacterized protein YndB with AHSA1/START domain
MTTPDVPLRLEYTIEVPGTPEQVWSAIATANGIQSWFTPTDLEEREGGALVFRMGEGMDSSGTVTGWDPPHRFAYVEPEWAAMVGHDVDSVTPLATEFLVEAQSGGTCVVRMVSSAFGSGADWEREFFDDMDKGWPSVLQRLRLYLTHFPGQQVTLMSAQRTFAEIPSEPVWSAMRSALGVREIGETLQLRGHVGRVEQVGDDHVMVRLSEPVPGFLSFAAWNFGDRTTSNVLGQLFSPRAAAVVEREEPEWQAWLDELPVPATADR